MPVFNEKWLFIQRKNACGKRDKWQFVVPMKKIVPTSRTNFESTPFWLELIQAIFQPKILEIPQAFYVICQKMSFYVRNICRPRLYSSCLLKTYINDNLFVNVYYHSTVFSVSIYLFMMSSINFLGFNFKDWFLYIWGSKFMKSKF